MWHGIAVRAPDVAALWLSGGTAAKTRRSPAAGALAAPLWGIMGFGGDVYAVIVVRRMRKQAVYQPEFEDWLFHVLLP